MEERIPGLVLLLLLSGARVPAQVLTEHRWALLEMSTNGICRYGNRVDCCWGWTRESWGQCRPVCELGCKHGECVGPDQCRCHQGYTGKTCNQDVNECGLKPRPCKHRCMNLVGSYKCFCLTGYMMTHDGTCRNTQTCAMANCQYGCAVMKGEVMCQCPSPGLRLGPDRRTCVDIDECVMGVAKCPRFRKCVNTFGSYICKCHKGFELRYVNGKYQCTGKNNPCHEKPDSKKCRCKPGTRGWSYDCKFVITVTVDPARPFTTTQPTTKITIETVALTTSPPTTTKKPATTTITRTTTTSPRTTTTAATTMATSVSTSTAPTTFAMTTAQTTVASTVATTVPTTTAPTTVPTTTAPTTVPTTTAPTTVPTTTAPTTVPTTTAPTTVPTTTAPTTAPTTTAPTTVPTTIAPTTVAMTTAPTTVASTMPTTVTTITKPTTAAMTTMPTTVAMTTMPTTVTMTTMPSTLALTTMAKTVATTMPTTSTMATTTALPSTIQIITTTLDNRIQEITQRPRGDVHIPRNPDQNVFELDFDDIELGNTADFARDDSAPGSLSCSFDQGVCSWMTDQDGDQRWETVADPHGGWYLTVPEPKRGRSFRGARLTIHLAPPTTPPWKGSDLCLVFRHRLQGLLIGSLQVFVKKGWGYSPAVWTRTSGQGWRYTQITLWGWGIESVVFKGERRKGRSGEIAIDDVSIHRGVCSTTGRD